MKMFNGPKRPLSTYHLASSVYGLMILETVHHMLLYNFAIVIQSVLYLIQNSNKVVLCKGMSVMRNYV